MLSRIFVSSFSTSDGSPIPVQGGGSDPLLELRHRLFILGQLHQNRVWVAEFSEPALGDKNPIERINSCLKEIEACTHVVILLAGKRRGSIDSGTSFVQECAASYLEIEWLYATASRKPLIVLQLSDFEPGPRLSFMLDAFGIRPSRTADPDSVVDIISEILEQPKAQVGYKVDLHRCITALFENRRADWMADMTIPVFLRGMREEREGRVDIPRLETWMNNGKSAMDARDRLVWYWLAYRELMGSDGKRDDFLPYYNQILSRWSAAASWCSLHGHIYLGSLASISTYDRVRSRMRTRGISPLEGDTTKPAFGAFASAYHSLGKLCYPSSEMQQHFHHLADLNVRQAMEQQIEPAAQLHSFYSIILLVQGRLVEALDQAEKSFHCLRNGEQLELSKRATILCDIGATLMKAGSLRQKVKGVGCFAEGSYALHQAALAGDGAAADFQRRNWRRLHSLAETAGSESRRILKRIFLYR